MNTKGSKKARKDFFTGMGFILPSLLGFLIFTFIPVVISLCLSFTSWNFMEGIEGIKFNGLANYIRLFSDEWFLNSYKNNIIFTAVTVPVLIALGLVMATIINKYIYGGGVVRTMIFIPYIASVVAVCTVWMVLLQPSYGPVNEFSVPSESQILQAGWLTSSGLFHRSWSYMYGSRLDTILSYSWQV